MRIPINPPDESSGPFSELFRLQTDFYTRLTEETLKYLRRLQGATAPAVPGTVVMPATDAKLQASGKAGTSVEIRVEVENRQRVHCIVTPFLSTMVDASGVTWFPVAEVLPPSLLLAPAEVATITVKLSLPTNLPLGSYHGALLMQGSQEGSISVVVTVIDGKGKDRTRDLVGNATTVRSASRSRKSPPRAGHG